MFKIFKANEKNIEELYNIIVECSTWLQDQNIKQWSKPYPKKLFVKDVSGGNVFYFRDDEHIVGTATLYSEKPFYYPDDLWNDGLKCWYLYRFAVPRFFKNRSMGEIIIKKTEEKAKQEKIDRIRIDVVKDNPFLENYYFGLGFCRVAEAELFDTDSVFMEKIIK